MPLSLPLKSWLRILAAGLLLPASCQVAYYGQALKGHLEVSRGTPVERLLDQEETSPELRQRLELSREIVAFAESDLLLPSGGSYESYKDLGREYVVWSVYAARELSVKPHDWRYPFVGRLCYRGFYRQEKAEALAESLEADGLETAVIGVPAYSSLGWSRDPLLNTFIDYPEDRLAGLIFHELAHQKYYRHGDTAFSEAFAVAVEEEGVRRWLVQHREPEALHRFERFTKSRGTLVTRVLETRSQLADLYESDLPDTGKRERKAALLTELQEDLRRALTANGRDASGSIWLEGPLTNAHLNIVAAYFHELPRFQQALREVDGDLARFYDVVAEMPSR